MSVSVVSPRRLLLWDNVVLENLCLAFNYPMSSGVKFSADLSFDGASDLKVILAFDDPSTPPSQLSSHTLGNEPIAMTATSRASWSGEINYDGTISVPDIISCMCCIDIKKALSSSGLALLRNFDFDLSGVIIELVHSVTKTCLILDANISSPIFKSLGLEIQKAISWQYSLKFNLDTDAFFSDLGIKNMPLDIDNMTIIISNSNQIGDESFPVTTVRDSASGLSVALSATLDIGVHLQKFKKFIGGNKLDIWGAVGDDFIQLYVETRKCTIFDSDIILSGYMGVVYNGTLQFVMLGKYFIITLLLSY